MSEQTTEQYIHWTIYVQILEKLDILTLFDVAKSVVQYAEEIKDIISKKLSKSAYLFNKDGIDYFYIKYDDNNLYIELENVIIENDKDKGVTIVNGDKIGKVHPIEVKDVNNFLKIIETYISFSLEQKELVDSKTEKQIWGRYIDLFTTTKKVFETPPKAGGASKLSKLTMPDLREMAKKKKLTGYSKLNKADLVKLIQSKRTSKRK
jgi:hypothetical protein